MGPSFRSRGTGLARCLSFCRSTMNDGSQVVPEPVIAETPWARRPSSSRYRDGCRWLFQFFFFRPLSSPPRPLTALHWAAKHGNEDIVKLIAGTYRVDPNVRSNGGYTPLHIATQFGHENVFNLLVKAYDGDPQLRDWSGRMPRQYIVSQDTSVSSETIRKMKARKKHSEKDLGFLRIGSLNVRVKRTTEAFSNFLGVGNQNNNGGSNYGSSSNNSGEKIHKSWGSADNIQEVDRRIMPPPKYPAKKRRSKMAQLQHHRSQQELGNIPSRALVSHSAEKGSSACASTPATPTLRRVQSSISATTGDEITEPSASSEALNEVELRNNVGNGGDSDSDTACGFDSNWKTVA
ncbi:uncharacterized protein LOC124166794 [Ischnura elegans]|uniref:uncharacterized protein LOC124166794 n=1 Tax=Ischnura elegans TaxID=197161 RepID=UPI001ED8A936|nr:uncharacterized protein LOC124166794 [Ischnura elegans]